MPCGPATRCVRSSSPRRPGTSTLSPARASPSLDGGASRAESVGNALAAVETELVAIHDAARPLLTPALVEPWSATLAADPEAAGVIPAAPVADTVKQARGRRCSPNATVSGSLDRALGGADAAGLPDRGAARGARGR